MLFSYIYNIISPTIQALYWSAVPFPEHNTVMSLHHCKTQIVFQKNIWLLQSHDCPSHANYVNSKYLVKFTQASAVI